MPFEPSLGLAATVLGRARAAGLTIATAESCTGGLVCAALTTVPGSSDVVTGGIVAYSNEAKAALLGVPANLIAEHGAVSQAVAVAMAEGALARTGAHLAVSVTGIAGPGGGSNDKPVGLVWIATAMRSQSTRANEARFGDPGRDRVRQSSVELALRLLLERL